MRRRALSAITIATAALLTSCAMGGMPAASAPQLQVSPTALTGEITVWSWDVAATALKRLGASYQKAHPDTKIKVVDIGYDNAYDKMSVGFQAGSGLPDLITVETERLPGYIESFPGKLVDLSSRIAPAKADFDPSKLAAASDASGKIFAMPWDSGTVALYLRTDVLKRAGVDPATLTTWDAFAAAAKQIKAKTGKTAIDSDLSTGALLIQMLQQQGTGIFNEQGKVVINNAQAVATLTLLRDMQNDKLINNVRGWDARVSAAKAGKSAFSPSAVWWSGTLISEAPELSGKWAVQPLPAFSPDGALTSNNGGSNLAVPSQAKNPDLAADFAAYVLMNVDNQSEMMAKDGLFPSYLPALSGPVFTEQYPYFGGQAAMKVFADLTAKIPTFYYTSDYAEASEILANASVEVILNGKDPKEALDQAAQTIAKQTNREIG